MSKQWRAYRKEAASERFQVVDENGNNVCKIEASAITRIRRWEDAKLIAAAPDLLYALQAVQRAGTWPDLFDMVDAAISKATE